MLYKYIGSSLASTKLFFRFEIREMGVFPIMTPPERGAFFRLQVYERVGVLLVEVYKRVGKSVIWVCEMAQRAEQMNFMAL